MLMENVASWLIWFGIRAQWHCWLLCVWFSEFTSVFCRDVAVCQEVSASLYPEASSSSFMPAVPAKPSEPDLAYSLTPHAPYLPALSTNEIYDIRIWSTVIKCCILLQFMHWMWFCLHCAVMLRCVVHWSNLFSLYINVSHLSFYSSIVVS